MAIRDLFSKRRARAARAGQTDVFVYDDLPTGFRVQVVHILGRAMFYGHDSESMWEKIRRMLAEDHQLMNLPSVHSSGADHFDSCTSYFLTHKDSDKALDVIELTFGILNGGLRKARKDPYSPDAYMLSQLQGPDAAISDLNMRFKEHSLGYQFDVNASEIIRVDSLYLHAEAVKPALVLLATRGFEGPEEEFHKAHKHYREGRYKEAVNEALKAFESTLKTICNARGWKYDKSKATAKTLLDVIFAQELIPSFLTTSFAGIRSVLEATVPTARNKTSGHGQGDTPVNIPDYFAGYVLHATAASIVLLVEAHQAN